MSRPETVLVEAPVKGIVEAIIQQLVEGGTLVEVVRCRDCQWYHKEHRMCTEHDIEDRDGSGYCSDGVPRKGENDETD